MQKVWTWSVSVSTMGSKKSHEEIHQLCRRAGLSGIEGAPKLFPGGTDGELEIVGARYREARLEIRTFHLPFEAEDDLASFYETVRRQAVERIRRWMERAVLLGVQVGIQHPSTTPFNVDVEGLDTYLRQLGKSLEVLLPVAENLGLVIALENMPPGEAGGRLGSRPEHFARFIQAFGHPNLGLCLDTGHALLAGGPERADEFFQVMAPYLVAFHLADNAGDRDSHLAPGRGLVNWDRVFRRVAELGYRHSMCIETPPFAPGPDYSVDAWRQMVEQADELVERALAGQREGK